MPRRRTRHDATVREWRPLPLRLSQAAAEDGGLCWVANRDLQFRESFVQGESALMTWRPAKHLDSSKGSRVALRNAAAGAASAFLCLDVAGEQRRALLQLSAGPSEMREADAEFHAAIREGATLALQAASSEHANVDVDVVTKAAAVALLNSFEGLDDSMLVFARASRFNHSCSPNVEYALTSDHKIKVRTLRPITANEELCISYLGSSGLLSTVIRREILKDRYLFDCTCALCSRPTPDPYVSFSCSQCFARVLPRTRCDRCGAECVESLSMIEQSQKLERKVAVLSCRWEASLEDHRSEIQHMLEDADGVGLKHHVVYKRLQMLLLQSICQKWESLKCDTKSNCGVDINEAWTLFEVLVHWFLEPWTMQRSSLGIYLAEPAAELAEMLKHHAKNVFPRNQTEMRIRHVQALLAGTTESWCVS